MYMPSQEAHRLITNYIQIKPEVLQEVETFAQENFQRNHVISIFYIKQPDQLIETLQPTLDPDIIIAQLKESLQNAPKNTSLFLVTKSKSFFDRMIAEFPNIVYFYAPNPKQQLSASENSLLDAKLCLLLSKTNHVIGVDSGMLRLVHQFNPEVAITPLDVWFPCVA